MITFSFLVWNYSRIAHRFWQILGMLFPATNIRYAKEERLLTMGTTEPKSSKSNTPPEATTPDPGDHQTHRIKTALNALFQAKAHTTSPSVSHPPPIYHLLPLSPNNPNQVNRNKKSIGLSFNNPAGISIIHKLAQKSDVIVENYLPGSLKKYSLDYETLSALNPSLIYASVTGYGQTGPYSDRAGYDVMVEAEMGLMHITGERDGPPVKVGVAVTDLSTGLYTAIGVLAALYARRETGLGQWVDASLSDCQVAGLANIASSALISGKKDSGRWGTAHGEFSFPCCCYSRDLKTRHWMVVSEG